MRPVLLATPNLWYCRTYPIDKINFSTRQERSHKEAHLPALLEHIRQHGLVNPLIVLNHRDPREFKQRWVMTGVNRLWAVKQLGWKTVPALVTGRVDDVLQFVAPLPLCSLEQAQEYFPDGELYWSASGNPRIKGYSNFLKGEFPSASSR